MMQQPGNRIVIHLNKQLNNVATTKKNGLIKHWQITNLFYVIQRLSEVSVYFSCWNFYKKTLNTTLNLQKGNGDLNLKWNAKWKRRQTYDDRNESKTNYKEFAGLRRICMDFEVEFYRTFVEFCIYLFWRLNYQFFQPPSSLQHVVF